MLISINRCLRIEYVVNPTIITVKVGPSQLNLETPAMGRNRLLINPRLDVKSIPNKQYFI
jgi:hypothetical protein